MKILKNTLSTGVTVNFEQKVNEGLLSVINNLGQVVWQTEVDGKKKVEIKMKAPRGNYCFHLSTESYFDLEQVYFA